MKELITEEKDKEMREMLNEEYTHLLQEEEKVLEEANIISLPSNKYCCITLFTPREDHKNCTIEVRAGAGGAEKLLLAQRLEMERSQLQRADRRRVSLVCCRTKLESKKRSSKSQGKDHSVYYAPSQAFT